MADIDHVRARLAAIKKKKKKKYYEMSNVIKQGPDYYPDNP